MAHRTEDVMQKHKDQRMWGITYTNCGDVMPDTIRRTRHEAQKACCDNRYQYRDKADGWQEEWARWKKAGCKAVKVIVRREA